MSDSLSIWIKEATAHYMNITCKSKKTGQDFDLDGYDVQTWISFGEGDVYLPNTIIGPLVSYRIPPELTLGKRSGAAETRIFKGGDVFEVLRVNISVSRAGKPDLEPHAPTGSGEE